MSYNNQPYKEALSSEQYFVFSATFMPSCGVIESQIVCNMYLFDRFLIELRAQSAGFEILNKQRQ